MGIKIYGMPISGCTQRVLAAAHEKNLDYELVIVDLRKHQQKEPSFLSLNVSICYYSLCFIMSVDCYI